MIELLHASKQYKNGVNALYDINLKVDQGEFVYIIGPTGSGKSTLIKLLDGEEIYQSCSFDSQMDALRYGRADAMERNANGEHVEYDIVITY